MHPQEEPCGAVRWGIHPSCLPACAVHAGVLYNCRVMVHRSRILLIRPKLYLANDGNYRETRYFAGWKHPGVVEEHVLPPMVREALQQSTAPFGDGVLQLDDSVLAGVWGEGVGGRGGRKGWGERVGGHDHTEASMNSR